MKEMNTLKVLDKSYRLWVSELAAQYRQSRIKSAIHVNADRLEFYWHLGQDIVSQNIEGKYGEGIIDQLSRDLTLLLPDGDQITKGTIYYCKRFYLLYSQVFTIVPQVGEQTSDHILPQVGERTLTHRVASSADALPDMPMNIFAIPWGHHKVLIDKFASDPKQALFYASKTIENSWSRASLLNAVDSNLYSHYGQAIHNFSTSLPDITSDLAKELVHDPYDFWWVKLHEKFSEQELKNKLVGQIEKLLLSLGMGYAFMGREYLLEVAGKECFSDLLFYNTRAHAYVVLEVKITEFEPSYLGQLSGYISLINRTLKTDQDNPTIGLLICKSKNDLYAQICLEGYNQPIAISAYKGIQILPENFNDTLQSIKDV